MTCCNEFAHVKALIAMLRRAPKDSEKGKIGINDNKSNFLLIS
jgi:hypothetical protein